MSIVNVYGILLAMRTIAAGEFKQHCLRLLDEVAISNDPIVVTKRGRPVAQLVPVGPGRREDWRGALRDQGEITGDVVAPAVDPREWAALRG